MAIGRSTTRNYLKAALVLAIIAIAVTIRIWHDRLAPSNPAQSAEAQSELSHGQGLYRSGRREDAQSAFEHAAQLAPNDAEPHNWIAQIDADESHLDDALRELDRSFRFNPNDSNTWCAVGDILQKQNKRREALGVYRHAAQVNPKSAKTFKTLGLLELSMNKRVESLRDLQQAALLGSNDFETESALSNLALDAGDVATAGPSVQLALELQPDNVSALLASARFEMMTDVSAAALAKTGEQIEKVMRSTQSSQVYLIRGRWNLIQRKYSAAITDLKEAIRLDPHDRTPHCYLSQAYAATHNPDLARSESELYEKLSAQSDALLYGVQISR
jgi:tetratricopeptide (TPR) repeat protein